MATWNAAMEPTAQNVLKEPDSSSTQWPVRVLHRREWDETKFLLVLERTHPRGHVYILHEAQTATFIHGLVCSQIAPLAPTRVTINPSDLSRWATAENIPILVAENKSSADSLKLLNKKENRECEFAMKSCSIGVFVDPFCFSSHGVIERGQNRGALSCSRICAKFDFLRDELTIDIDFTDSAKAHQPCWFLMPSNSSKHRLEYSFSILKENCIVTIDRDTQLTNIFLYHTTPPKTWLEYRNSTSGDMAWKRDTGIEGLCDEYPGFCSVLKIELEAGQESKSFGDWKAKMELGRFNLWWGHVVTVKYKVLVKNILEDSRETWYMKCLFSLGYNVTDNITERNLNILSGYENHNPVIFARTVKRLCHTKLVKEPIVNVMAAFREIWESSVAEENADHELPARDNIAYVRHVIVTPTAIRYLPSETREMNRVIRHFKAENFVRVSFCDEDENKLCSLSPVCLDKPVQRIKAILREGISSDGRRFAYLGSSNSQLRQHSCWFYATTDQKTVLDIKNWMGNLSGIRCVASYVKRLGQFFSSSKPTVYLEKDDIEFIEDIKTTEPEYCFTDGVGTISKRLAFEVAKAMQLNHVPSAYQIRMAGIKGVLAVNPSLGDRRLVQVGPSMNKFPSDHFGLEVIETSTAKSLYLNRQVITLLSGAGIPDEVFLNLEEDYLLELTGMLLFETQAAKELSKYPLGIDVEALSKAGFPILIDPYFRALLLAKYDVCLRELRTKSRIAINPDKGRLMMGVVDETRNLQYGQVFIQFSTNLSCPQKQTNIHTGPVVVTKNPCFHPGDLRKLEAVDCSHLHHMVDVIVFPCIGQRPHPNEISGSDLDGDMYWVCWHEKLIPSRDNYEAMEFPVLNLKMLDHDPSEDEVLEYIGEYIKNDHLLGSIANAHVVFADREGIESDNCIQLASLHSSAVDSPQTGKYPRVPSSLRPTMYPDFIEKGHVLNYYSESILGKLFRLLPRPDKNKREQSKSIKDLSDLRIKHFLLEQSQECLHPLRTDAEQIYEEYARRMVELLTEYGLKEESDLFTGTLLKLKQKGTQKTNAQEVQKMAQKKLKYLQRSFNSVFRKGTVGEGQLQTKARVWGEVARSKEFRSFAWIPGTVAIDLYRRLVQPMTNAFLDNTVVQYIASSMTYKQGFSIPPILGLLRIILGKDINLVPVHLAGLKLWSERLALPIIAYIERTAGHEAEDQTRELLQYCESRLGTEVLHIQIYPGPFKTIQLKKISLKGSRLYVECNQVPYEVVLTTEPAIRDLTNQLSTLFRQHRYLEPTAKILVDWAGIDKLLAHNLSFDALDIVALLIPLVQGEEHTAGKRTCDRSEQQMLVREVQKTLHLSPPERMTKASIQLSSDSTRPLGGRSRTDDLCFEDMSFKSAELLIRFFMFYSKRENLVEVRRHGIQSRSSSEPILKRYTEATVSVLHMSVLRACSLLITSLSVHGILGAEVPNPGGVERTLRDLSDETHGKLLENQQFLWRWLEESTGCSICVHDDIYKEAHFFTLEAVGDHGSRQELDKQLGKLERNGLMGPSQKFHNGYALNSYLALFEGSTSSSDLIQIETRNWNITPVLLNGIPRIQRSQTMWRKRIDILRDSYHPSCAGNLRVIARLGTSFYTIEGSPSEQMSVEEFNMGCNRQTIEGPQNGSTNKFRLKPNFRPRNISESQIKPFLQKEGFEEHEREGRVVYKGWVGTCLFDERLRYVDCGLDPHRWCTVVTHPFRAGNQASYDVRVQIESTGTMPKETAAQYKKGIESLQPIMHYSETQVPRHSISPGYGEEGCPQNVLREIQVDHKYETKTRYIRQKEVVKYRLRKDGRRHQDNRWSDHIELHVSWVREYQRVHDKFGPLAKQNPKVEVMLVIPSDGLPRLDEAEDWVEVCLHINDMALKVSRFLQEGR